MAKVTVEDLKQRFLVRDVAPHGTCVMVPGDEFDPDWEACLDDEGYRVVFQDFDRKPFAIVPLKRAGEGEKVVFEPPAGSPREQGRFVRKGIVTALSVGEVKKEIEERAGLERVLKGKDTPLGPRWTEDEYQLLMKLWKQKKKVRVIAESFPGRSGHAVACALARLKDSGAIKPRWVRKGSKREVVEPLTPQPSMDTPIDAPVKPLVPVAGPEPAEKRGPSVPSISTTVSVCINVDCSNKEAVENLLRFLKELST